MRNDNAFKAGNGIAYYCVVISSKLGIWPIIVYFFPASIVCGIWYFMEGDISNLMLILLLVVFPVALSIYNPKVWLKVYSKEEVNSQNLEE